MTSTDTHSPAPIPPLTPQGAATDGRSPGSRLSSSNVVGLARSLASRFSSPAHSSALRDADHVRITMSVRRGDGRIVSGRAFFRLPHRANDAFGNLV